MAQELTGQTQTTPMQVYDAHASVRNPALAVRGMASGSIMMAIFSLMWASVGIVGLNDWGSYGLFAVPYSMFAILLVGGIYLIRAARRLPVADEVKSQAWKGRARWFGIIFGVEAILLGISSGICLVTQHMELLFPVMAIIVGVHFFPLASVFQRKLDYFTGVLSCIIGAIGLFIIPDSAYIGVYKIASKNVFIGLGMFLVVSCIGVYMLIIGHSRLKTASR